MVYIMGMASFLNCCAFITIQVNKSNYIFIT